MDPMSYTRMPLLAGANLPRIDRAKVRGTIRASMPDSVRNAPYFPGVTAGSTVTLKVYTSGAPVTVTATIPLPNPTVSEARNALTTALGSYGFVVEEDGVLAIVSNLTGSNSRVEVTATSGNGHLLGFDPRVQSFVSASGDIPSGPLSRAGHPYGAVFPGPNEDWTSESLNAAMGKLAANMDVLYANAAQERPVLTKLSGTLSNSRLIYLDAVRVFTGKDALTRSSGADALAPYFFLVDANTNQPKIQRVVDVVLGSTATGPSTESAASYGDAGKSVLGQDIQKVSSAAITALHAGSVIESSTGNFIVNGVEVGDFVTISSATNLKPWSNNGRRWVVEKVVGATHLQVRPASSEEISRYSLGTFDDSQPVLHLNTDKQGTESYGTISVHSVGFCSKVGLVLDRAIESGESFEVWAACSSLTDPKSAGLTETAPVVKALFPTAGTLADGPLAQPQISQSGLQITVPTFKARWKDRLVQVPATTVTATDNNQDNYVYWDEADGKVKKVAAPTGTLPASPSGWNRKVLGRVTSTVGALNTPVPAARLVGTSEMGALTVGAGGQFETLRGALEFVRASDSSTAATNPRYWDILLVSSATVQTIEAVPGLRIRGASPDVVLTFASPSGQIQVTNTNPFVLENLTVQAQAASSLVATSVSGANLTFRGLRSSGGAQDAYYLAHVTGGGSLENLLIEDCSLTLVDGLVSSAVIQVGRIRNSSFQKYASNASGRLFGQEWSGRYLEMDGCRLTGWYNGSLITAGAAILVTAPTNNSLDASQKAVVVFRNNQVFSPNFGATFTNGNGLFYINGQVESYFENNLFTMSSGATQNPPVLVRKAGSSQVTFNGNECFVKVAPGTGGSFLPPITANTAIGNKINSSFWSGATQGAVLRVVGFETPIGDTVRGRAERNQIYGGCTEAIVHETGSADIIGNTIVDDQSSVSPPYGGTASFRAIYTSGGISRVAHNRIRVGNGSSSYAIFATGQKVDVEGNWINYGSTLWAIYTNTTVSCSVKDNYVESTGSQATAILIDGSTEAVVSGNHVLLGTTSTSSVGIDVRATARVVENYIKHNASGGTSIKLPNDKDVTVAKNTIVGYSNTGFGISLASVGATQAVTLEGNTISVVEGSIQVGTPGANDKNLTVSGNVFKSPVTLAGASFIGNRCTSAVSLSGRATATGNLFGGAVTGVDSFFSGNKFESTAVFSCSAAPATVLTSCSVVGNYLQFADVNTNVTFSGNVVAGLANLDAGARISDCWFNFGIGRISPNVGASPGFLVGGSAVRIKNSRIDGANVLFSTDQDLELDGCLVGNTLTATTVASGQNQNWVFKNTTFAPNCTVTLRRGSVSGCTFLGPASVAADDVTLSGVTYADVNAYLAAFLSGAIAALVPAHKNTLVLSDCTFRGTFTVNSMGDILIPITVGTNPPENSNTAPALLVSRCIFQWAGAQVDSFEKGSIQISDCYALGISAKDFKLLEMRDSYVSNLIVGSSTASTGSDKLILRGNRFDYLSLGTPGTYSTSGAETYTDETPFNTASAEVTENLISQLKLCFGGPDVTSFEASLRGNKITGSTVIKCSPEKVNNVARAGSPASVQLRLHENVVGTINLDLSRSSTGCSVEVSVNGNSCDSGGLSVGSITGQWHLRGREFNDTPSSTSGYQRIEVNNNQLQYESYPGPTNFNTNYNRAIYLVGGWRGAVCGNTIQNFSNPGYGAAIFLEGCQVSVTGNYITSLYRNTEASPVVLLDTGARGIVLKNVAYTTISGNKLECAYGVTDDVTADSSNHVTISGNVFQGSYGVYLNGEMADLCVSGNVLTCTGASLFSGSSSVLTTALFSSNRLFGAVSLYSVEKLSFQGNDLEGSLTLSTCTGGVVVGNTVKSDAGAPPFKVAAGENVQIVSNTIQRDYVLASGYDGLNYAPIDLNAARCRVQGNTITLPVDAVGSSNKNVCIYLRDGADYSFLGDNLMIAPSSNGSPVYKIHASATGVKASATLQSLSSSSTNEGNMAVTV